MSRTTCEVGILQERFGLHASPEVALAAAQAALHGEVLPNDPGHTIGNYLGNLGVSHSLFTSDLPEAELRQDRHIEARIIKPDALPESYFVHLQKVAEEQGYGERKFSVTERSRVANDVRMAQTESLKTWVSYLSGEDCPYPIWFKYFAYRGVTKLGQYNTAKKQFETRTRATTAPFTELNPEALALVYEQTLDKATHHLSFGRLYANSLREVTSQDIELDNEVKGSWVCYSQGGDADTINRLTEALRGKNTTWCTASSKSTAKTHLEGGDFHVYYTTDKQGETTQPRIAVRMSKNSIAEIRGILPSQTVEPHLINIVAAKIETLPGGGRYAQALEDMRTITRIQKKLNDNQELSLEELEVIYRPNYRIVNVLGGADPRVPRIINSRQDPVTDLSLLYPDTSTADLIKQYDRSSYNAREGQILGNLFSKGKLGLDVVHGLIAKHGHGIDTLIAQHLADFTELDDTVAQYLLHHGHGMELTANLHRFNQPGQEVANFVLHYSGLHTLVKNANLFPNIDVPTLLTDMLARNPYKTSRAVGLCLPYTTGLDISIANTLIRYGRGKDVARNLGSFSGIDTESRKTHQKIHRLLKGSKDQLDPAPER
jgi:hypothetical protein